MKLIIFITSLLISLNVSAAPPLKVAILDTGFTPIAGDNSVFKLCPKGHYDYSTNSPAVGDDIEGHGAFVTYLINQNANTKNMCFLIYKVLSRNTKDVLKAVDRAFIRAYKSGAKVINVSFELFQFSYRTRNIIKYLTKRGVKIFVATGNDSFNLNDECTTYPVCFNGMNDNLVIVGASDWVKSIADYSNYGARVTMYERGDVFDAQGSSFAAPRALGKYVRFLNWDKRK